MLKVSQNGIPSVCLLVALWQIGSIGILIVVTVTIVVHLLTSLVPRDVPGAVPTYIVYANLNYIITWALLHLCSYSIYGTHVCKEIGRLYLFA